MYIHGEDRTPFRPQNRTMLYTKAALTDALDVCDRGTTRSTEHEPPNKLTWGARRGRRHKSINQTKISIARLVTYKTGVRALLVVGCC